MRLTIAYSKMKKRNLVLIDNATYQRETLTERPIWQPLTPWVPMNYRKGNRSEIKNEMHTYLRL